MPRKCCVGVCKGNYASQEITVNSHGFPTDPAEKQSWLDALPNIVEKIT